MKIINKLLIAIIILVGLLAAAPLVFPYTMVIPQIEQKLGRFVHGKATIGNITFRYAPRPILTLHGVVIDKADTATIGTLEIPLGIDMLLGDSYMLKGAHAESARISSEFAQGLPQRLHSDPAGAGIETLSFSNSTITLQKGEIGPLSGQITFYKDGRLSEITLTANEGLNTMRITPAQDSGFMVEFQARNWTLPLEHAVKLDTVRLAGRTNQNGIDIDAIQATLYGGTVNGNGRLSWDQGWALQGQLQGKQLNAGPFLSVFSPVTRASGRMDGTANFSFKAEAVKNLLDNPAIQGRFEIKEGQLHNIDLVSPLKAQGNSVSTHGGQTAFNLLSGAVSINPAGVTLSGLTLDSGKFRASGSASIVNDKLAGSASTQLISGPVALSGRATLGGTLSTPQISTGGAARPGSSGEKAPAADEEIAAQ